MAYSVVADGVTVYESGTVDRGTATKAIDLDVTGARLDAMEDPRL